MDMHFSKNNVMSTKMSKMKMFTKMTTTHLNGK